MTVVVGPRGTRGVKLPRMGASIFRVMNALMFRMYKNRRFQNANVLQLTTTGARTGQERRTTLVYYPDTAGWVLVVGSAGGTANHPAWFFNIARNPDKVWAASSPSAWTPE